MQHKVSGICLIILTLAAAFSAMNFAIAATSTGQATTTPHSTAPQIVSTTGNGWINPAAKRDDFSFFARGGELKTDGWRYNPNAQASFTGRDLRPTKYSRFGAPKSGETKLILPTRANESSSLVQLRSQSGSKMSGATGGLESQQKMGATLLPRIHS